MAKKTLIIGIAAAVLVIAVATIAVLLPRVSGGSFNWGMSSSAGKETEGAVDVDGLYETAMAYYENEQYDPAFIYFALAADNEHPTSEYMMGYCYMNGLGTKTDVEMALLHYKAAANDGYSVAAYALGQYHEKVNSYKAAYDWYLMSAKDHSGGMRMVGYYHEIGRAVEQDLVVAIEWYDKAVGIGLKDAATDASRVKAALYPAAEKLYAGGSYAKALKYFIKSAEYGNQNAMYYAGVCYENGLGTGKDLTQAFKYYEKAAAKNHSAATLATAFCYANGQGTAQNYSKALEYFLLAERLAETKAYAYIADIYYNGRAGEYDFEKAYDYYKKAYGIGDKSAEQYINAAATLRYARYYFSGVESAKIRQDYAKAFKFYGISANAGNAEAMNMLGHMYSNGKGTSRDLGAAFSWYKKSADLGFAEAMYNTALMYNEGNGTARNYEAAFNYFTRAAASGYAAAKEYITAEYMLKIGTYYHNGVGVSRDDGKALAWYTKAADNGNAEAMYNIGMMCETDGDYDTALAWYQKAKDAGFIKADEAIGRIKDRTQV